MAWRKATSFAGHQPKEYLLTTIVLNPSFGPNVAMSAGGSAPTILKNRRLRNESHHPSAKRLGPRVPNASVAVQTFALMKSVNISNGFWFVRSSAGTLSIPPSSAPYFPAHSRSRRPHVAICPAGRIAPVVTSTVASPPYTSLANILCASASKCCSSSLTSLREPILFQFDGQVGSADSYPLQKVGENKKKTK